MQTQEGTATPQLTEVEVSAYLEKYRAALREVEQLRQNVRVGFDNLPTLEDKFKFVLEFGSEFLDVDDHYCPHELQLEDGYELCLYDDFFWEKYETKDLSDFFADMYYSFVNEDLCVNQSVRVAFMVENYTEVLNHNNKHAALVRHMLSQGIGRATYNW